MPVTPDRTFGAGLIRRPQRDDDAVGVRDDLVYVDVDPARHTVHVLDNLAPTHTASKACVIGHVRLEKAHVV